MPEGMEENENNEGVRNLRGALEQRDQELETLRQQLAERDEAEARRAQEARVQGLTQVFGELNLPPEAATLYPQDQEVTSDRVAEWASTYGITARQPQAENPTLLDRYNDAITNAWSSNETPESDLTTRIMRGVVKARDGKFQPTQSEIDDMEDLRRKVNAANRSYEREVLTGRAQAFDNIMASGYGGRISPPMWANYTLESNQS